MLVWEAARRAGIDGGFAGPGLIVGKGENSKHHREFLEAVG